MAIIIGAILTDLTAGPSDVLAGGGPEKTVVVVNANSWASLSVANEFIHRRNIPPSHVIALDLALPKGDNATGVDTFREKILKPVLAAIKDRGLENMIDCVAYSADIPTAIDFSADSAAKPGHSGGTIGSINSLTFLHEMVLAKQPYWSLDANRYFRKYKPVPASDDRKEPLSGLELSLGLEVWSKNENFPGYLLSTVLAVTSNRGNSIMEAMACLRRAAAADGTNPDGAFYFMSDYGIRTKTRNPLFAPAIARLKDMGRQGRKIYDTSPGDKDRCIAMPTNRPDIMGAMLGQQYPNPPRSGSKTLPGAIVENLTSEGGIMSWAGGQVPITDFIRFGAAGTSGTVTEPNATWQKFPTPFLFVHYAAGCSLAEAFYQSVSGPFQLLIIGDPLCRPYAQIPDVVVDNLKSGQVVPMTWTAKDVKISAKNAGKSKLEIECFVDGAPAGKQTLSAGYHELMAVAVSKDDIASRGFLVVPFIVREAGQFALSGDKPVALGQEVKVRAAIPGARKIEIRHCGRVVKTIEGAGGECEISSLQLGLGQIRLDAAGEVDGKSVFFAPPVFFEVIAPEFMPAISVQPAEGEDFLDGPLLTAEGIGPLEVLDMWRRAALQEAKVPVGGAYRIEAFFDVLTNDLCQFQVWTDGPAALKIDDVKMPPIAEKGWTFLPVALAGGKHRMLAEGKAGPGRELEIRYGPPGTRRIGKRCHNWDAEHPAMHFSHLGKKPPATSTNEVDKLGSAPSK